MFYVERQIIDYNSKTVSLGVIHSIGKYPNTSQINHNKRRKGMNENKFLHNTRDVFDLC